MNFLTSTYLLFFALAVLGTYLLPGRYQNHFLLAANYIFYLWANPTLGLLLAAGTLVGYGCARAMERERRRRLWLTLGVLWLFGALFVFKYLDFFCQSVLDLTGLGGSFHSGLVLPIGISFYSFSLAGPDLKKLGDASEAYVHAMLERGFKTLDFYKGLAGNISGDIS